MDLLKRKFQTSKYEMVKNGEGLDLEEIVKRFEITLVNYEDLKNIVEEYNECNNLNISNVALVDYFNSYARSVTGSSDINKEICDADIEKLKADKAIILYCLPNSGESVHVFVDDKNDVEEITKGLNDILLYAYDSEYIIKI